MKQLRIRISVVLPAPFGPSRPTISALSTSNETSSSAGLPSPLRADPYRFVTPRTLINPGEGYSRPRSRKDPSSSPRRWPTSCNRVRAIAWCSSGTSWTVRGRLRPALARAPRRRGNGAVGVVERKAPEEAEDRRRQGRLLRDQIRDVRQVASFDLDAAEIAADVIRQLRHGALHVRREIGLRHLHRQRERLDVGRA